MPYGITVLQHPYHNFLLHDQIHGFINTLREENKEKIMST